MEEEGEGREGAGGPAGPADPRAAEQGETREPCCSVEAVLQEMDDSKCKFIVGVGVQTQMSASGASAAG